MIDGVTKRITELKALSRLPMHDKQIYRLPHTELTSIVRVDKYILKDKVVLVDTDQEFGFSLATVHIKSLQAKRVLYSHNSEETFPLQELVDKNYVQGFLLFINGYFIPWKYINLVCLTEKNYLIIHVDKNDEIGMSFIKNNRANSLKVDIVTIPNSYKYKELDETISGTPGIDFVMGFSESLTYSKTDVKYILYCLDDEVEHSYNQNDIIHDSESTDRFIISDETGRYYDEECCFVFNDGLFDSSIDIKYTGNILNITGKGKLSYVACHSKRYERCENHISKLNQNVLYDRNDELEANEVFRELVLNKFDIPMDRKQSYFKNVQDTVASIIGYDSRLLMDYICNKTCSMKTFEFTGKQIIDSCGPDNIFRISKFYDVALDDKVIVIKNGMLYGLKIKDYRGEDISLSIDRWRIISLKRLDDISYDEWLSINGPDTINTEIQDEWLSTNSTNPLNDDAIDHWNGVIDEEVIGSDEDCPTDNWYEISENGSSDAGSDNDNWYEVQKVVTIAFLEPDMFERDIKNSHTFNVPVIEVEETDIVEFLIFQHTNNLIHDTIFNEDDDFDYLSEDVYNLSTNIFCRETNDDYFEFPDNGVQHFPVSYRIEHDETDPYKRRIRYDDEFYYGKEVVLSNKRRFVHKRHIISAEDASGICFDFGTKFMYCNEYANYILFFNGRRLNKNQYRLVLPVRSTTPFFWFYVYLGVFFTEGDVLDIYYTPTPMRDVYITQIESDGIVEVPKENLNYPLNLDSYIFWANGYKVPRSKIRIIDSNRLQITEDMRTIERFTITEIVDERPESWIIDDFQTIDSEWDRLMRCIDIDLVRSLLNISDSTQSNVVIDLADLSTQTLMHELILKWYYKSTYVDTTKPFIYDYQDPDTDLDAIKEFDSDNNAVLIALDASKTNRSEKAEQTHRYLP